MQRTVSEIGEKDDVDYLSSTHHVIGKSIRSVNNYVYVYLLFMEQLVSF